MKKKFKGFFNWNLDDLKNDIRTKSEVQANRLTAITMLNIVVVCLIALLLARFNVFILDNKAQLYILITIFEFIIPAIICFIKKGRGSWIKYVLIVGLVLGLGFMYIINSTAALLGMLIPIVLSGRYYSSRFVTLSSILSMVMICVGAVCGVLYGAVDINALDSKWYPLVGSGTLADPSNWGALIKETLLHSVLINELLTLLIAYICVSSAVNGRSLVQEELTILTNTARISSELNLAADIQKNMLPCIFPAFPEHEEFDVYAKMEPAKEVGGDFYDFFMVDDSHVAIVIGDVSGKGVPAALFMVTTKTLIKDYAQLGLAPAEVFIRVNKTLCEGNTAGLFVTGWMGVLDLKTGVLTYVNAGHNAPYIYHVENGKYEKLNMKPGFVLGGLDTVKYRQASTTFAPNDKIFLYTDGVTEATSINKELYGDERLVNFLDNNIELSNIDLLHNLRKDIDTFVEGAEQFDDITMLVLSFSKIQGSMLEEKVFIAQDEKLQVATDFINEVMEKHEVPMKVVNLIDVAFEEIFVNIAHYAYPSRQGKAFVGISVIDNEITLVLKDKGIPFDPLSKEDPDITLSAEDRDIGGLGIYMVKKTMDKVEYQNKDGMNILTIIKKF